MTSDNFCYWLRGFFELLQAGEKTPEKLKLNAEQVEMIDKHLKSVFQEKIMQQNPPITLTPWTPETGTDTQMPQPPYTVTCQQQIAPQAIC